MEPLSLSGLASGLDTTALVDALINFERIPQNRLRSQQSELNAKSSAYSSLRTRMEDLQSSMEELGTDNLFFGRTTSLAGGENSSFIAASENNTITGNYTFDITQLATNTTAAGTADVGARLGGTNTALSELNLSTAITGGTITINGAQITVNTDDTLQDLFDEISTQTTAAGDAVTASYDSGTDKITLSAASGAVILGSATDDSNFFAATKLTSNASGTSESSAALGGINFSTALDSGLTGLNNPITADGTFSINGEEFTIDADVDSLQDIVSRINESDAGVTLSYDSSNDQFTFKNNETGAIGMALDENGSGFFTALGIDTTNVNYTLGDNAEFTVNGGSTLTSTSNTLTGDAHGITGLSMTAIEIGSDTVSVTTENTVARDKIENFIEKYNDIQTYLREQTRITVGDDGSVSTALLAGNTDMNSLSSALRTAVFNTVSSLTGDVKRLQDIGIDFVSGSNNLRISDSAALDEALAQNSSSISTLFTEETEGLNTVVDSLIDAYTTEDGTLDTLTDSINRQNKSIDKQIEDLERFLTQRQNTLEASFARMEEAQANINQQLSILNSTF